MDHPFRSAAVGGFNRQDVLAYLEERAKLAAQAEQKLQDQLDEVNHQAEALRRERDGLRCELEETRRELEAARQRRDSLSAQLEQRGREQPSPVFISAIRPWWRMTPPTTCTGKWRICSTRLAASRQAAKASGRMSSRLSPSASRFFSRGVISRSRSSSIPRNSSSRASTRSTMGWMRLSSFSE